MNSCITQEVIDAFKQGDIEAFDKIFLAYNKKIKFFVAKIVRSNEDAEEISQDIFVKLWEDRELLNTIQKFNSYVFVMAKNSAINFLRKKTSYKVILEKFTHFSEDYTTMEDEVNGEYIKLVISMIASTMPKRHKTIFLLSQEEGLDNEEIAARLNISKKSVENSLSLTKAFFRNAFKIGMLFLPVCKLFFKIFSK